MIKLYDGGVTIQNGRPVKAQEKTGSEKTIARRILDAHNSPAADSQLHITFDGLISHDIT